MAELPLKSLACKTKAQSVKGSLASQLTPSTLVPVIRTQLKILEEYSKTSIKWNLVRQLLKRSSLHSLTLWILLIRVNRAQLRVTGPRLQLKGKIQHRLIPFIRTKTRLSICSRITWPAQNCQFQMKPFKQPYQPCRLVSNQSSQVSPIMVRLVVVGTQALAPSEMWIHVTERNKDTIEMQDID